MRLTFLCIGVLFPMFLSANTLLINGNIYTVNKNQPWAEAIVIDSGLIRYVGSTDNALSYCNSQSHVVDLKEKFVMPGIIDAHTHTAIASLLLNSGVDLLEAKGKKKILQTIKSYVETSREKVISGFGFYPYVLGKNGPTAKQLDGILGDKKAFLISNNGHSAWVNTNTMKYLNISHETKDPLAGMHYYMRDKKGMPTGFLIEGEAFWPHFKKMNIATKDNFYKTLKSFLPRLSKQGITAIFDAGAPAVEENAFKAILQLENENKLPLRYFGSHYIVSNKDAANALATFREYNRRYNASFLNISTVKFCNDNSDDDNFAIQFNEDELYRFLKPLVEKDIDIMIHTSHDKSVNQSLNTIEKLKSSNNSSNSRIILAHVNMVRDSDFLRFYKLGVIANIQPFNAQGGAYYDYRYMLYEDWKNKMVRFKNFFYHNITVSASSDFPACNTSLDKCTPFDSMQIAVTRQAASLDTTTPVLDSPDEKLSVEQIIDAFTINAAYQLHQEKDIGSLELGKKADIIVLNQNLLTVNKKKIHKTIVEMTILNGEIVYER